MAESKPSDTSTTRRSSSWSFGLLVLILTPVAAAIFLYQLDSFDPASLPTHEFSQEPMPVPKLNPRMLQGSEMIGQGNLLGPEDVAYDANSHLIYTGSADGWVKRVTLNESAANSVVHNWAFTGGRPLGVALGRPGEVLVADAEKGLLEISGDGVMKLLTDEAEGLKFKQTNAVDVAVDGMIYFTDASYKYGLIEFIWEILEGRPHGRLLSFDPSTQETIVLLRDLYLANGVVVSPDQTSVVFCETLMKRCIKYYIQGERKVSMEKFIDNLSGMPDNILYDGEGHYWIALATGTKGLWDLALKYPSIRKVMAILERYIGRPHIEKNGGILAVDLKGKPIAHYYDPELSMVSSGIKVDKYLYCGSFVKPYIIRLDLDQHAARTITLKRSIYGLKQASRQWYRKFDQVITSFGFKENTVDQCIYLKFSESKFIILVLYVDDILLASSDVGLLHETKRFLSSKFDMKDLGNASFVLGIQIHRNRSRGILGLSQKAYIDKVLSRFGMSNCAPGDTLVAKGDKFSLHQCPKNELEKKDMERFPHASVVGSLMYAQVCTRPDIAYIVGMLGRYLSNPGMDHWKKAKRVMRYLQRTKDYMLTYRRSSHLEIVGYSDSDFAGCLDSRRSTSGYIFMLAGGAVSWKSVKQTLIASSTMWAEFIACYEASNHGIWLRNFVTQLRIIDEIEKPLRINCDNKAAELYSKNNRSSSKSKHIDIKFLVVKERVQSL